MKCQSGERKTIEEQRNTKTKQQQNKNFRAITKVENILQATIQLSLTKIFFSFEQSIDLIKKISKIKH